MGQCFSSTYATVEVPFTQINSRLPDVERNEYVFSDGIVMISVDLAKEVAEKLQLNTKQPCAYQIRYAGFKGVVACWPAKNNGPHLQLRQKVHDENFWRMQELMVSRLDRILEYPDMAFDVLAASCTDQWNTSAMMLAAGFRPHSEPHLRGMLTSIRISQLVIQVSKPSLEDCFANHGSEFSETKRDLEVIKGLVVIAKNPCLHPGDVRIPEVVDIPGLHLLYD
ncbi:RNA-dependent RNA polymerase [Salvia divinorum]|uniref:RNA-dependent RNA polymerase n=1 Tax=Salvia divinorum TaxID=28513 RepID=A0ABD1I350_SALDI